MTWVSQYFPTFFYNGRPMNGGTITFYNNNVHTQTQAASADSGGVDTFVSKGIDENGQIDGVTQLYMDDTLGGYYVVVRDSGGTPRYTYHGLPDSGSSGTVNNSYNTENLFPNPQFYQHQRETLTIVNNTNVTIAPDWQFRRSSTIAPTDTMSFQTDLAGNAIGAQVNSTPSYWFRYIKSTVGTAVTEIKIFHRFPSVRAFAGKSITIRADVRGDSAYNFNFYCTQNYGTGGAAAVTTVLGTKSITAPNVNLWVTYEEGAAAIPALGSPIVDRDDYFEIGIDITGLFATTGQFDLTNLQLFLGNNTVSYDWSPIWYDASTSIPTPDPLLDDGKILVVNDSGYYELQAMGDVNKNLIWGGDFSTNPWQEGSGLKSIAAAASATQYLTDGYKFFSVDALSSYAFEYIKQADAPTLSQCQYYTSDCLRVVLTAGNKASPDPTDIVRLEHVIEGYDWREVQEQKFTISFWIKSNAPGTYCVALKNNADDLSYIHEYTISASDTWEKIEFTVEAYSSGSWNYTTGKGLQISWTFIAGTNYTTATANKDKWSNYNGLYATDAITMWGAAANNYFQIALPQCHQGDTSPPYARVDIDDILAKARRYYEKSYLVGITSPTASQQNYSVGLLDNTSGANGIVYDGEFQEVKRITPSMTIYNNSTNPGNIELISAATFLPDATSAGGTANATTEKIYLITAITGGHLSRRFMFHWVADARF